MKVTSQLENYILCHEDFYVKSKCLETIGCKLSTIYPAREICPQNRKSEWCYARTTIFTARKAILAAGWQLLVTVSPQDVEGELFGQAKRFWDKGYREVESCAGTGSSPCAFSFSDAYGNTLRVTTTGEEDPSMKRYARVSNFEFVCE